MAHEDTPQQAAALRQSKAARAVRTRFPEGTRVVARTGGMAGTVTRHVLALTSQGGHLLVEWDNGQTSRVQPATISLDLKGYTVAKSHYAQGPSLYEWVVTKEGTETYETFPTRKLALDWIQQEARP